jgi:hypothetical protein
MAPEWQPNYSIPKYWKILTSSLYLAALTLILVIITGNLSLLKI